ncbi:hypothetical protein C6366_07770 [Desulfonatronum sp. SC1]|nr:hypothetical protein C6366_07770 [Desulfonatronum sp. SC1]
MLSTSGRSMVWYLLARKNPTISPATEEISPMNPRNRPRIRVNPRMIRIRMSRVFKSAMGMRVSRGRHESEPGKGFGGWIRIVNGSYHLTNDGWNLPCFAGTGNTGGSCHDYGSG